MKELNDIRNCPIILNASKERRSRYSTWAESYCCSYVTLHPLSPCSDLLSQWACTEAFCSIHLSKHYCMMVAF